MAGHDDRNVPGRPRRVWLLTGVSLAALAIAGPPARAGNPPLFSPQWFAVRGQAGRTAALAGGSGVPGVSSPPALGSVGNAQAKAAQSIADLTKMAAVIRQAATVQAAALAAAANVQSGVANGLVARGPLRGPGG